MSLFIQYSGAQPKDKFFRTFYKIPGLMSWHHGPVREHPGQVLIASAWRTAAEVDTFRASDTYTELLDAVKSLSDADSEMSVYTVGFGKILWWSAIDGPIEMRTVYFPTTISEDTKNSVRALKGLRMRYGIMVLDEYDRKLIPYRCGPVPGWVDWWRKPTGSDVDEDKIACAWLHSWTTDEREQDFKETKRLPLPLWESTAPLIIDDWERQLREMGALGWDDIHVDLKLGT